MLGNNRGNNGQAVGKRFFAAGSVPAGREQCAGDHRHGGNGSMPEMFPPGHIFLTFGDLQRNIPAREQGPVWTRTNPLLAVERLRQRWRSDR